MHTSENEVLTRLDAAAERGVRFGFPPSHETLELLRGLQALYAHEQLTSFQKLMSLTHVSKALAGYLETVTLDLLKEDMDATKVTGGVAGI